MKIEVKNEQLLSNKTNATVKQNQLRIKLVVFTILLGIFLIVTIVNL